MDRSIFGPAGAALSGLALLASAPAQAAAVFPVAPASVGHGPALFGLGSGAAGLGLWVWLPIVAISALCVAALVALVWQQRAATGHATASTEPTPAQRDLSIAAAEPEEAVLDGLCAAEATPRGRLVRRRRQAGADGASIGLDVTGLTSAISR